MSLSLITGRLARWTRALAALAFGLWLIGPIGVSAQSGPTWVGIGPPGGTVLSLTASPLASSVLYAGTSRNGVFMSADSGQTWSAANTGLSPTANSAWRTVRALAVDSQYVYAATDAGLFYAAAGLTANDLPNWAPIENPNGLVGTLSLLIVDTTSKMLLAATTKPDPSAAPALYAMPLPAPAVAPSGSSWVASPLPSDTVGSSIGAATVFPGVAVFVAVADRIFVASIVGATSPMSWVDDDPLLQLRQTGVVEAVHFAADFSQVYACSGGQLLVASSALDPPNNTWSALTVTPMLTVPFNCAGMTSGGLAFGSASAVAVATSAGVYLSTDGTSFAATQSLGVSPAANAVSMVGGGTPTLFVGAGFGVASQPLSSLASSASWNANNGSTAVGGTRLNNANATDTAVIGTTLYAAVAAEQYADVLVSTDAGATWSSTGLKAVIPDLVDVPVLAADTANQVVYAGTSVGLYALAGGTWVQIAAGTVNEVNTLAAVGGRLFVGTDSGLYALALRATPSSSTVTPAGLAGLRVSALHSSGGNLYAGVFDLNAGLASVSVASSATSNPTWADFATGVVGTHRILSLLWTGSTLLAASRGELVSVALPGGAWASANNGLSDPSGVVNSLSSDGSVLYAATGSNGVFTSPLGASAWSPYSGSGSDALPSLEVHTLRFDGSALYAATAGGVAAVGALTGGPSPTPPPATSNPPSGGGGGAIDVVSLLALLCVAAALSGATRKRRRATR
jgi:hypothetical protein